MKFLLIFSLFFLFFAYNKKLNFSEKFNFLGNYSFSIFDWSHLNKHYRRYYWRDPGYFSFQAGNFLFVVAHAGIAIIDYAVVYGLCRNRRIFWLLSGTEGIKTQSDWCAQIWIELGLQRHFDATKTPSHKQKPNSFSTD